MNITNFIILLIIINMLIVIDIIIIHFNENRKEREKIRKTKDYGDEINSCIWEDGYCMFGKRKIEQQFIDSAIEHINSYDGEKREKIIGMVERAGMPDYLYNKYRKSRFETDRKLCMYFMGEIRSGKYFQQLLLIEKKEILKKRVVFEYYFAIIRIFNQTSRGKNRSLEEIYSEKLYDIFEIVDRKFEYEIDKFCNLIILEGVSKYHEEEERVLGYLLKRITDSNLSIKLKGEIIYTCAIRQIKSIKRYIYNIGKELLSKEQRSIAETELLIKIVKAYGELKIKQGDYILIEAAQDKSWNVRATAIKYIKSIDKNRELFRRLISDENWWVRNNSAEVLADMGKAGEEFLLEMLKSGDKFARETAAYRLSVGEFGVNILRAVVEGNTESVLEIIRLIINSGNNMNILDIILKEELIKTKDKIKVLRVVKNNKFLEYYENSMKYRNYEKEIEDACALQLENIFREAVLS